MGRGASVAFIVAVVLVGLASCAQEEYPAALWNAQHASAAVGSANSSSGPTGPQTCAQARATSIPARLAAIGAGAADAGADAAGDASAGTTYFVEDLYQDFLSICGRCHGSVQALGGFQITDALTFQTAMTPSVIAHVTSDGEPSQPELMPPVGSPDSLPYSQRPDSDPVKQFAELVEQWLMEGTPASFTYNLPSGDDAGAAASSVASTAPVPNAFVGNALTEIGNCIPSPALVATQQAAMAALDATFAAAAAQPSGPGVAANQIIGLPIHLSETDLTTFDSAILAQNGVIAYAPAYPLWSDNAFKLRYIRVPLGTSIQFDKATQSFAIPPNTRFYKTFTKQIIDTDGSIRYQKIETRLIVSRPDQVNADGSYTPTALFGTYKWNADESDAELETLPLQDGDPFSDDILEYDTNEPLAADILAGNPGDPAEALIEGVAARHYAVPSSQRCMQCHEGSESHSFVLGFMPLQINRRPTGIGGITQAAGPDELTQLQRFIDYSLITGIDSPSDVLPLEQSEGTRTPRNNYELLAQGYMLGNCAHCHNPTGYPSVQNPVLVDVLDFVPGPNSGIFQFPLEKYSPRIFRGTSGANPIPYITPSLVDLPRYASNGSPQADVFVLPEPGISGGDYTELAWYAPWRSLIYRNTDNPFAYTDDFALYPHMPMNTPGYDPTAKQVFSDWMVSIPAVRKNAAVPEYAIQGSNGAVLFGSSVDPSPQPYVEVLPGDPRYAAAVAAAQARLAILHSGSNPNVPSGPDTVVLSRYADPGETADILDPAVEADPLCTPVPVADPPAGPDGPLAEQVPGHCHWVPTDTTQPPGLWSPRRPDWESVLVEQNPSPPPPVCGGLANNTAYQGAQTDATTAVTLLQSQSPSVALAGVRPYLTTPVPFGPLEPPSGCDVSQQPTVSSFTGASEPQWVSVLNPSPSAPVYMSTPGEAVFKEICINCHGPLGNATGRLAQNLAIMTGGLAQVADLRDGLFGPVGMPDSDIQRVFGLSAIIANDDAGAPPSAWTTATLLDGGTTSLTADDVAARYMAWMALGGTQVNIPIGILELVAVTQVLDQHRVLQTPLNANMLSAAKTMCTALMGPQQAEAGAFTANNPIAYSKTLIHLNGDAELWLHLCTLNNPPPIHVIDGNPADKQLPAVFSSDTPPIFVEDSGGTQLIEPSKYPAGAPVGDHHGNTVPYVSPNYNLNLDSQPSPNTNNLWPWCDNNPKVAQANNWPLCPPGTISSENTFTTDDEENWTVRGAINAGAGVFLYVQSLETMSSPPPDYDECPEAP